MKKENLYLRAPNYHRPGQINLKNGNSDLSVFLAGSISGASNWQENVGQQLIPYFNVFNPRRFDYIENIENDRIQIPWEHFYLNLADIVLFYFSYETLAPITLFEYGKMLEKIKTNSWKKLYVCINPDYRRKNDVIIQTELDNPELAKRICFDLNDMVKQILLDFSR